MCTLRCPPVRATGMLDALCGFTVRHRKSILAFAGLWFALAVTVLSSGVGRLSTGSIRGLESDRAGRIVDGILRRAPDTSFIAVFTSSTLDPTGDAFRDAMQVALSPLAHDSRVGSITTPYNAGSLRAFAMTNERAHAAYAYVSVGGDFRQAAHAYPALRRELRSDTLSITCTGRLPFARELDETLEHCFVRFGERAGMRRENLEQTDHPKIGDQGNRDEGADAKCATNFGIDARIVCDILTRDWKPAANTFAGETPFYFDRRAERRGRFAKAGSAQHFVICEKCEGRAACSCEIVCALGDQVEKHIDVVTEVADFATNKLDRQRFARLR